MNIEASYSFAADRKKTWDSLLDPTVLAECIPGCREFELTGEDTYDVVLEIQIAAITGRYTGSVKSIDQSYLESYKLVVEGQGPGGTVKGYAVVTLSGNDSETYANILGEIEITGVMARVGQRLVGSVSRMLMNQFFGCLKTTVEK